MTEFVSCAGSSGLSADIFRSDGVGTEVEAGKVRKRASGSEYSLLRNTHPGL
jgi:acyl CoA:acetate/3-ketoacid CoA transferase alpha subunit